MMDEKKMDERFMRDAEKILYEEFHVAASNAY